MFSGAMDILVIQSPDGEFKSSSFHVRFGSLQVIQSRQLDIDIYINGKKKDVHMKLSSSGDGYFQFDKINPYIKKQSKLITNNETTPIKMEKDDDKKYMSFFPSSSQIKKLELKEGANEICFVCKTNSSGIQTIKSSIYLWPSDSKIIISDVDGTITRSDVLGQVLTFFGRDWSHEGVADLFTNIHKNGYNFIYLTARAIGQSTMTKNYLDSLIQEEKALPPGPMFMSPDGLFTSFKREVIERKPHLLKIPLLTEIKNLFPEGTETPFYAGFGNRDTDGVTYRYMGVPLRNIFIINTSSDVVQLGENTKTSYKLLNNSVDVNFPNLYNSKGI